MGMFTKLSRGRKGLQKELGEAMESTAVTGLVIALIMVDLSCTVVNDVLENTDLLNPKYGKQGEALADLTHRVCVSVLCVFVAEQLGHLVAYGAAFFGHAWMVMDLLVVCLSLLCETVLEDAFHGLAPLLVVLRLWKVAGFVFDIFLSRHEDAERDEKLEAGYKSLPGGGGGETTASAASDVAGAAAAAPPPPKWKGVLTKMSQLEGEDGEDFFEEEQRQLGELLESPTVTGVVILLILVDLCCTVVNDVLESTDLLNPKYHVQGEWVADLTHMICVGVLCVFVVEQLLHLVAYGRAFFSHTWLVMDLCVVCLSLLCETVLEDAFHGLAPLLMVLRLWKVVGFIFDVFLSQHEDTERDEKLESDAAGEPKPGAAGQPSERKAGPAGQRKAGMLTKMSRATSGRRHIFAPAQKQLGEFLESPKVTGVVILLILVDLSCTVVNDVLENTDLLNPKYHEQGEWMAGLTHKICVGVLCVFVVEQLGHLLAYGRAFFSNLWFVMDLCVVCLSLLCETVLEDTFHGLAPLLVVLRLWKVVGFIFDVFLSQHEDAERDEKLQSETSSGSHA